MNKMTPATRALSLILALTAAPASAGGLSAAVDAALSRSPLLAEARDRRAEAAAAEREASWSSLPRLSARASFMRSDDPLFAFGERLQERRVTSADFAPGLLNDPGYRSAVHGALELGVPLFTGFQLTRARRLGALAGGEAEAAGDAAAQAVSLRVTGAYLAGLLDRQLGAELDARLASAETEVESARRLKAKGLILGSDFQAALAILSGLKAWRAQVTAQAAASDAELSVLTGAPGTAPSGSLDGPLPALEDDAALVASALSGRPELRAAVLREQEAAVRRQGAAQSVLPTVDAFASVETADDGLGAAGAARLLGVRAVFPFGDPAWAARLSRARSGEAAARQARAGLEDSVRGEVLARAAAQRGALAALPDLDESLDRARRSLEEVRPLYREGRQSVMEVLRAEEGVARARQAQLEALAGARREWASARFAQGRLDRDAVAALARGLEGTR